MKSLLILSLALCSLHANAMEIERFATINAVGACQASLPSYDQKLRKKPLTISNEGMTPSFISCSAQNHVYLGIERISVSVRNNNEASAELQCTLVDGDITLPGANYVTKTTTIPANDATSTGWQASTDNGGSNFFRVNFSCKLPAGMELGEIYYAWMEDVGE